LNEVAEVIALPKFDAAAASRAKDYHDVVLDNVVMEQLHDLVAEIASTYRDNPFHSFEHACHVTMAASKFLQRIVSPDLDLEDIERAKKGDFASELFTYTHGINSDPLAHTAIIFVSCFPLVAHFVVLLSSPLVVHFVVLLNNPH
jgi:hypothetical protein